MLPGVVVLCCFRLAVPASVLKTPSLPTVGTASTRVDVRTADEQHWVIVMQSELAQIKHNPSALNARESYNETAADLPAAVLAANHLPSRI